MAITLSSEFLKEFGKASPEPVVFVAMNTQVPSSKTLYFHNGDAKISALQEGDPVLLSVTSISQEYDPLERDIQVATLQLEVIDNDHMRGVMENYSFYDADCLVYLISPEILTSDGVLIFRGRVESVRGEQGSIIFDVTEYQSKLSNHDSSRTYLSDHPLEVLNQAFQDVGIPSGNIDSASFASDAFSDISHYCFSSYGINGFLTVDEALTLRRSPSEGDIAFRPTMMTIPQSGLARVLPDKFLKEYQQLTQSVALVDEAGVIKMVKVESSTDVTRHFTTDDYRDFEQDPDPAFYNVITVNLGLGTRETPMTIKDDTSVTAYGERVAEISSVYLSPASGWEFGSRLDYPSSGKITITAPAASGFAGTRNLHPDTQTAADKIDADNPFYGLYRSEIIKTTGNTVRGTATTGTLAPFAMYNVAGARINEVVDVYAIELNTMASRPFAGTEAVSDEFPYLFTDITAVYNFATTALTRYSNSAPKIIFTAGLEFVNIELGDLISIDNDFFVSPELRLSALDSSVKFEVVGREIMPVGDDVGVRFTAVYITKTSAPATSIAVIVPPNPKESLGSDSFRTAAALKAGMDHSVLNGLDASATSGLGYSIAPGALSTGASVRQMTTAITATATASKDTYLGIDAQGGQVIFQEVSTGAAEPALSNGEIRIAKIVSDGSAVSSVVDLRRTGAITAAQFNRELLMPANGILWNGGFEDWADPGRVPMGWTETGDGVMGTDTARETSVVHSGSYALKMLNTSDSVVWYSGYVPIDSSTPYRVSLWARQTGDVTMRVDIDWYTSAKVAASAASASVTNAVCADDDTWENRTAVVTPGSDVAYAKLKITRPTSPNYDCYWDDITIRPEKASFNVYGAATTAPGTKSAFQVKFNNESHDYGGNYDHSGSAYDFEAPSAGTYQFSAGIQGVYVGAFTYLTAMIYKNGAVLKESYGGNRSVGTLEAFATVDTGPVELAKGDLITVYMHPEIQTSFTLNTGASQTWFSGRKIE